MLTGCRRRSQDQIAQVFSHRPKRAQPDVAVKTPIYWKSRNMRERYKTGVSSDFRPEVILLAFGQLAAGGDSWDEVEASRGGGSGEI